MSEYDTSAPNFLQERMINLAARWRNMAAVREKMPLKMEGALNQEFVAGYRACLLDRALDLEFETRRNNAKNNP